MKNFKTGTLIAIAAGGLFVSACKKEEAKQEEPKKQEGAAPAPAPAPTPDPGSAAVAPANPEQVSKIDCLGVNACKGQGTCKQEGHGCGGQNECKGKGLATMTAEDCKAKGGTVVAGK